jgi:HemK-related putative methylase
LHRWLFGYAPTVVGPIDGEYWDWTTLILRKALRHHLKPTDSFLDMGTGPVGVLAIYSGRRLGCEHVLAVDHLPLIVTSAKRNAERLGLNIEFLCSDLFTGVDGCFDVIAFNAPYLDIEKGRCAGILKDELAERRFGGGKGGGETIERFLHQAPQHISKGGVLLLGVNHYHIPRPTVRDLISQSGLELRGCLEGALMPACAYVLCRPESGGL